MLSRDYMVHQQFGGSDERAMELVDRWMCGDLDGQQLSGCLAKELQSRIASWPPVSGTGVTLLKINDKVSAPLREYSPTHSARRPRSPQRIRACSWPRSPSCSPSTRSPPSTSSR